MCQETVKGRQCKRTAEPYCFQHNKAINIDSKKINDDQVYTQESTDMSPLIQTATEPLSVYDDMQNKHEVEVVEVEISKPLYSNDNTSDQITQKNNDSDETESTTITPASDQVSTSKYTKMNDSQNKKRSNKFEVDIGNDEPRKVNEKWVEKLLNNPPVLDATTELLLLIKGDWFRDQEHIRSLTNYYRSKPFSNQAIEFKTFIYVLRKKMHIKFDLPIAISYWNTWSPKAFVITLSQKLLRQMAAGYKSEEYSEWKAKYEPDITKKLMESISVNQVGSKPIDILRTELLNICKNRFRRVEQTGAIYEHKYDYYYTHKFDDPALFLTYIFRSNELYSSSSSNVHKELIYFIKHIVHPDFEFMQHDYDYIGFTNGVYDLSTATFIPTNQLDKTIQVRKLFNQEYKITSTPLIDMYLKYQFDEDDIEFIYFLLGRSMTRLTDHFDFMLLLHGQGGSGKSLLMKLISSTFASNQVGILSSSFQGQFGLCEFTNRQLVCSDDMPSNLAKTLDKGDFLKMMTRGAISCPVKGKSSIEVHDWNIPTIINSNTLPNYKDISGEIVRRVMVINFENVIPEEKRNTNLESDIISNEISSFLHKCRSTYLKYKTKYHGKGVETFCPQVFLDNRKLLRISANNTCAFINDKYEYSSDSKDTMTVPELNKIFKIWMKERYNLQKNSTENINAQSIESIDKRITYKRIILCKYCKCDHKKGCCSNYARTDRTSQDRIYNIKSKESKDSINLEI